MPQSGHLALQQLRVFFGVLFCLACLSPLSAIANTGDELTAEQLQYDPTAKSQADKVGAYTLKIEAVPTRLVAETAQLNGALDELKKASRQFGKSKWFTPGQVPGASLKTFTYFVMVGEDYDPGKPAGVLVGISAGGNGDFLRKYKKALADKNIIIIGSNQSGNNIPAVARQVLAIYAVELLKRRYTIDPNRVYITGGSGGGRAASITMYYRPDLFKGGMPMIGSMAPVKDFATVSSRSGKGVIPGLNQLPSRAAIRESMTRCRYAFLTGEKDFNRKESELTAEYMQKKGYQFVTVFVQPKIGHDPHSAEYFLKGLNFLDAPLFAESLRQYTDATKEAERGRLESALSKYESALPYLQLAKGQEEKTAEQDAIQQIASLNKQYEDALGVLDGAIAADDTRAAQEALRDLQRSWRDRLGREAAAEYRKKISAIQRGG